MDQLSNDPRFAHIPKDPKFRRIPQRERKLKTDKRFRAMFTDKKFSQKYTVDKRGRPLQQTSTENLKKYYDISSSEDDGDDDDDGDAETDDKNETSVVEAGKTLKKGKVIASKSQLSQPNNKRTPLKENIVKEAPAAESEPDVDEEAEQRNKTPKQEKKKSQKKQSSKKGEQSSNIIGKYVKVNNNSQNSPETDEDDSNDIDCPDNSQQHQIRLKNDSKGIKSDIKRKLNDLTVDYARGEGALFSESSSDEDSTSDEEEEEEGVDHNWGELDKEAETTDEITSRLAACNMDWDKIRAVDLMVVFNSFLPPGGCVKSVMIYPSEFGMQRMKEEEVRGPKELVDSDNKHTFPVGLNDVEENSDESEEEKSQADVEEDDSEGELEPTERPTNDEPGEFDEEEHEEGSDYHMERMRQYQLNRLKYYYAVIAFDSAETANTVYTHCDGIEYEATATKFDLRFIPEDMEFDQEPKEVCEELPELPKYQPRQFTTTALQQVKVELTWDETKPERLEMMQKLNSGKLDDIDQSELQAYIACGSSDEEGSNAEDDKTDEDTASIDENDHQDPEKYRSLFKSILEKEEEKKKKDDVGLEFTWGLGTKEKAEKLVQESMKKKDLTPFEQYVEKRKEKIKEKRQKRKNLAQDQANSDSDDSVPSDVDLNDPYFAEEFEKSKPIKKKSLKKHNKTTKEDDEDDEEQKSKAQLELLLLDEEDEKDKRHFNMKTIEEGELLTKSKKKRLSKKKKEQKEAAVDDNFEVNVNDPRFSALFTSHHYNIDPADPHYRKTKGTEALVNEKLKRRADDDIEQDLPKPKNRKTKGELSSDLAALVKSVKMNAKNRSKPMK